MRAPISQNLVRRPSRKLSRRKAQVAATTNTIMTVTTIMTTTAIIRKRINEIPQIKNAASQKAKATSVPRKTVTAAMNVRLSAIS